MTAVGFITFISVISRFKVTWFTYKMGYNYLYIMSSIYMRPLYEELIKSAKK